MQLNEAGSGAMLRSKTVLITGVGGSIGSELCRQVAHFVPARLVLVELIAFNFNKVEREPAETFPGLELVHLIGDVKELPYLRLVNVMGAAKRAAEMVVSQ